MPDFDRARSFFRAARYGRSLYRPRDQLPVADRITSYRIISHPPNEAERPEPRTSLPRFRTPRSAFRP
jgi:hypothetical protein